MLLHCCVGAVCGGTGRGDSRAALAARIGGTLVLSIAAGIRIADLLDAVAAQSQRSGVRTVTYGHAGDGNLHVNVLREGVHSGEASGIVPSSFRIQRMLLRRLEDETTGRILPEWLYTEIPQERIAQVHRATLHTGEQVVAKVQRPGLEPAAVEELQALDAAGQRGTRTTNWFQLWPAGPSSGNCTPARPTRCSR